MFILTYMDSLEGAADDLSQQDDELHVLESIYPNEFRVIDPDRRY